MRRVIEVCWSGFLVLVLATALGCGSEEGDDSVDGVDAGDEQPPPDERCGIEIVDPIDDDDCLPDGANANIDNDCNPVCGNDVLEDGEECDDGNTSAGDGCDGGCANEVEGTAFRINSLSLREPHVFAIGFIDVTNTVNTMINDAIVSDLVVAPEGTEGEDGLLDFSLLTVFKPFDSESETTNVEVVIADCTAPIASTECVTGPENQIVPTTATNMDSTCLEVLPDTAGGYFPAITTPGGRCFASDSETLELVLGGISLSLAEARIGATYADDEGQLVDGLMMGFLSIDAAAGALIPDHVLVVGGLPISELLKEIDQDTGPDGDPGWWFYLNFTAVEASYTP